VPDHCARASRRGRCGFGTGPVERLADASRPSPLLRRGSCRGRGAHRATDSVFIRAGFHKSSAGRDGIADPRDAGSSPPRKCGTRACLRSLLGAVGGSARGGVDLDGMRLPRDLQLRVKGGDRVARRQAPTHLIVAPARVGVESRGALEEAACSPSSSRRSRSSSSARAASRSRSRSSSSSRTAASSAAERSGAREGRDGGSSPVGGGGRRASSASSRSISRPSSRRVAASRRAGVVTNVPRPCSVQRPRLQHVVVAADSELATRRDRGTPRAQQQHGPPAAPARAERLVRDRASVDAVLAERHPLRLLIEIHR
jgi:hypothetical protein